MPILKKMARKAQQGWQRLARALFAAGAAALLPGMALADGEHAKPWQLGYQEPASPIMHMVTDSFWPLLLTIITVITVFVFLLLVYVVVRFNKKANPVPSKTSHNTLIEVVWTLAPILILIVIAIPSFRLLYAEDRGSKNADFTIKATGHQWYWTYEYPDHGGFSFDSLMVEDKDLTPEQKAAGLRLLETDNHLVVPVGTVVRVQTTATDVVHSWALPAFGVKMDAMPGRLNETWFKAEREGTYYGQCSELCGKAHAFMPIAVDVVSQEKFQAWVAASKQKYGALDAATTKVALADTAAR